MATAAETSTHLFPFRVLVVDHDSDVGHQDRTGSITLRKVVTTCPRRGGKSCRRQSGGHSRGLIRGAFVRVAEVTLEVESLDLELAEENVGGGLDSGIGITGLVAHQGDLFHSIAQIALVYSAHVRECNVGSN